MSWANELYNVYEIACKLDDEQRKPLPIFHTEAKAQLEVTVDKKGDFKGVGVVYDNKKKSGAADDPNGSVTAIPVTEDSGARSSDIAPHPLADKLVYIAGDYCKFCKTDKNDTGKFSAYIEQLRSWAESEFSHPSVKAIYAYLSKGCIIGDIVKAGIFKTDNNNMLTKDKIEKIEQKDCFVRFTVNGDSKDSRTWCDKTLQQCFINYYTSLHTEKSFCYATGTETVVTYKHPSKILNSGDMGKLFSANDETGFTFRGRFLNKEQAFAIGYEFSQKMHNALKWLIERQGVSIGNMKIVAWDSSLTDFPNVCAGSCELISDTADNSESLDDFDDLSGYDEEASFASYKNALHKAIFSTDKNLKLDQKIMIMILDEAIEGKGRISVNMYSELLESEFRQNVESWHNDTAWHYRTKNGTEYRSFALYHIADLAYGTEQGGKLVCQPKLKGELTARLIPCVTEKRNFPRDVLRRLVNRASRPLAFERESGDHEKILECACGFIRKIKLEKGEECNMALDENSHDSSYLFGRLIAVAEVAERSTFSRDEDRATNAERFFERFSNSPGTTWTIIYNRLKPYLNKMEYGTKAYYQSEIDNIMHLFENDDFSKTCKLKPEFLLAYSCQRKKMYTPKNNKSNSQDTEKNNTRED